MKIILASSSPRRQDLLRQIGLSFEVLVPRVDEDAIQAQHWHGPSRVGETARQVALAKARAVVDQLDDESPALVVAADTMVMLEGVVLGKPRDASDAERMLGLLSGATHEVVTGVAVWPYPQGDPTAGSEHTQVTFARLTHAEIEGYVRSGEPLDKAGGYGIQGVGSVLVRRIEGSYDNVVGLPLHLLYRLMTPFGVKIL